MPDSNGCAIVLKFNNFNIFYLYICELARKFNAYSYELIPISITKYNADQSEKEKINQIIIDDNQKIQKIDNVDNNKEIEHNIMLNLTKKKDNSKRKINNIATEINKKVMNPQKKRKIEETLQCEENNILNNKRNKMEQTLQNINQEKNNINTHTEQINSKNISGLKLQKKLNSNIITESRKRKIADIETEIKNTSIKKKKCINTNELNINKTYPNKSTQINKKDNKINKNIKYLTSTNCSKKVLKINIPDILEEIHKKKNQKKILKSMEVNKLCKEHGYSLKICLIEINNVNKIHKIRNKICIFSNPINTLPTDNKRNILYYNKYKYGNNLEESIEIFNKYIAEGPIYVCSICQQNQFKDKVTLINKMYSHKKNNNSILELCRTNYKSIDDQEYICNTCKKQIYKNNIPRISVTKWLFISKKT